MNYFDGIFCLFGVEFIFDDVFVQGVFEIFIIDAHILLFIVQGNEL
jgi:hypothetical protein